MEDYDSLREQTYIGVLKRFPSSKTFFKMRVNTYGMPDFAIKSWMGNYLSILLNFNFEENMSSMLQKIRAKRFGRIKSPTVGINIMFNN